MPSARCIVLCCLAVIFAATGAAAEPIPARLVELQEKVNSVLEKVAPAVVAIRKDNASIGNGVIVTPDGVVLTHGHHGLTRRDKLTLTLASGQEVSAHYHYIIETPKYDLSVARIDEPGTWPYTTIAPAHDVPAGTWCLHLGHPRKWVPGRPPVPRMGSVVETEATCISASCMIAPGDSGSPLLDEQGRVLGICNGLHFLTTDFPANYVNSKSLRRALDDFQEMEPTARSMLKRRIDRQAAPLEWNPAWESVRKATVQVSCDGRQRALGLIVDEGGLILTKRSQLFGHIACRLFDERVADATIVASSPQLDLALLRVPASGLPVVQFSPDAALKNGFVIVNPGNLQEILGVGIISDARVQEVAPLQGIVSLEVQSVDGGLKVISFPSGSYSQDILQIGDMITRLANTIVRTQEEFTATGRRVGLIAGDRMPVSFLRDGQANTASLVLNPEKIPGDWERDEFSDRRGGFGAVMIHDAVLRPQYCGGALTDSQGAVLGMNIAKADRHETLFIPSATLLPEIERLLRDAKQDSSK